MARCDSYTVGECTWGACRNAGWVRDGWGNAKDWWRQGGQPDQFQETLVPTVGAIVVFGPGYLYDPEFGHCAQVQIVYSPTRFRVYEMNYAAWDAYDVRDTIYQDVVTFILPPNVAPGAGTPSAPPPPVADRERARLAWSGLAHVYDVEWPARITDLRRIQGRARALVSR